MEGCVGVRVFECMCACVRVCLPGVHDTQVSKYDEEIPICIRKKTCLASL